jgi:hypothetical protein
MAGFSHACDGPLARLGRPPCVMAGLGPATHDFAAAGIPTLTEAGHDTGTTTPRAATPHPTWTQSYSPAGTTSIRRFSADSARYSTCQSDGPFEGDTCTAVTLYSGQLVAQSEYSVVTTLAWVNGWWNVV